MAMKLEDFIDIIQFQMLQDRLNEICSFPSAIIDNDGSILTATAWQDVCTKFHRQNRESEKECIKSDRYIASHLQEADPAVSYRCPHGLIDNAMPIIIEGVHYGNYFTGQFFLEPPNLGFFRAQAKKYGFDEDAYIEAVKKVPIWTKEQLHSYLFFIKGLIEIVSGIGLKNLKQKEAGKKIQESEERRRTILQTAMDGFWLLDMQGRLLEVNETYCWMSGYSEQELLTMRIPDLEAVETALDTTLRIQKVLAQGEDRFETRHRRKDGSVFDVEVSVQYRQTDGGQMVAFLRDISERKRTEEVLDANKAQLSAAMEIAHLSHWEYDVANDLFTFNDHFYKIFRTTVEQVGGYTMPSAEYARRFLHPDDIAMVREETRKALETTDPHFSRQVEHRIVYADGTTGYINVRFFIVKDSHGRTVKTYGVHQDITDRKRVEEELRKSEERFRLAYSTSPDAINITRMNDGMYVDINEGFTQQTGFTKEDVIGRTSLEINIWCNPADRQELIDQLKEKGSCKNLEVEFRRKDGSVATTLMSAKVIVLQDVPHILSVTRDISDRKRADKEKEKLQAQLLQSQKMESVGRLAGGVAHDFNNMLGVILGRTETAMERVDPDEPLYSDLEEIRKAANRSTDLARQLLAFARKQTVSPRVLDLNETVAGTITMLQRLIGEDIRLTWRPGANTWQVKVDPSQIDQILANLSVNARDAIAGVGNLTIETQNIQCDEAYCAQHVGCVPGDYVLLVVSDDGCGMDKEIRSKLFEPFFTTKAVGKGTGLGLATVYGIVKQNNGFIDVYSEPDQGTTFKVYLPRYLGKVEKVQSEGPQEPALPGHETILLVEDEPALLKLTTMLLKKQGYNVLAADTPGEAIRLAREHADEIHLLLTDVIMPEMNGRELAKNLLALYPRMKRLFTSGYTADVIAHHGVLDQGVHFMQKPFTMKDLAVKVREALDQT